MDCFYAAIEVRDDPSLHGKPVAVGGLSRGVLTTANYEARKFGCRSAMPTFKALQLCPGLVVRPTRFDVYKEESEKIGRIFHQFTDLVEPLSLDEAYLDVTDHGEEGSVVASRIRGQIEEETGLTASAGIAPNKLLAKIASDWNKPDGQFEIKPADIEEFLEHLPVTRLHGVGRKTAERLFAIEVRTCGDLQCLSKLELAEQFGSWGMDLYSLCRGRDERPVKVDRVRKSVSSETTLQENVTDFSALVEIMEELRRGVEDAVSSKYGDRVIRTLVVKLKFSDFTRTTAEGAPFPVEKSRKDDQVMGEKRYRELLEEAWRRGEGRSVRLIGVGVRFADLEGRQQLQLDL